MEKFEIENYALSSYALGILVMIYSSVLIKIVLGDTRFFIVGILLLIPLGLVVYNLYRYKLKLWNK